jgi:hypothetical protein
MEYISINEAGLANVLEEIYKGRRKKGSDGYSRHLAQQIFKVVRKQDAAAMKFLGLETYPCDEGLIGNAP